MECSNGVMKSHEFRFKTVILKVLKSYGLPEVEKSIPISEISNYSNMTITGINLSEEMTKESDILKSPHYFYGWDTFAKHLRYPIVNLAALKLLCKDILHSSSNLHVSTSTYCIIYI